MRLIGYSRLKKLPIRQIGAIQAYAFQYIGNQSVLIVRYLLLKTLGLS